jgi:hypothetical protein
MHHSIIYAYAETCKTYVKAVVINCRIVNLLIHFFTVSFHVVICWVVTPYILVHYLKSVLNKAVHMVASCEAIGAALHMIPVSQEMTQ